MNRGALATLLLTVFLDLLGFGLVVPFLPRMARELGASDLFATMIAASFSLMQLVFVPLWGRLSDRIGRRPVLLVSIAATVVSGTVLAFASSLPVLIAARLIAGCGTANIAVAQAYVADVTTPATRARGMGMIGAAFGFGFIIGPIVGGRLAELMLWGRQAAAPALAAAALSALNLVLAFFTLREPERARDSTPPLRIHPLDVVRFVAAIRRAGVVVPLLVNLMLIGSFSGFEVTFTLFTMDTFAMDARATGNVFGVLGVTAVLVQGGLIRRLARFGEARVIRAGALILSAGFIALALSPRWGASSLYVIIGVLALGIGIANPSLSAYVSKKTAASQQGATLGVLQSSGALARVIGPAAGGALYQHVGHAAPYVASAIGMAIAALIAGALTTPPSADR